jgi:carbonic anhydrase
VEGLSTEPLSPGDFIGKWISLLEPAVGDIRCEDTSDLATRQKALEEAGIRNSLRNLMSFPCISILVENGRLQLHGAWFDISTGALSVMDPDSGQFHPLET